MKRPGLWISGILTLALTALCLPRPGGPGGETSLIVGGLGLGAVVLQAFAAELPSFGLFSSGAALTITAALLGGAGAGLACLFTLSALFLRALLRARGSFQFTLRESLADAVPELAAICVIARGGGWLGCLVYVPLAVLWPRLMGPGRTNLFWSYAGVAGAGLLAGSLDLAAFPWRLAPLLLVLAALQRLPAAPARRPRGGWSLARGLLPPEPPKKSQEQLTQEYLARTLSGCQDQVAALDAILQVVAAVCPSRSQAIFLDQEGKLVPVRYQSPLREKLDGYALLGLTEPVVEAAWRKKTSLAFPPVPPGGETRARLFEGEHAGAALVLAGEGVLYVGRPEPPLTGDELHLLDMVAAHAVTALRGVRSLEAERQAMEQYRREHRRLEEELQRLQSLLDGTRSLASTLDFGALEERLTVMLRASIPHDFGAILTLSQGQLQPRRQWGAQLDAAAAVAVSQAVLANGLPLTLEGRSRLAPLVASQTALVAAPMQLEQGATGVLILGSTTGTFEREHQDLLWMIACLSAISFSNAALHDEVVSAQAQLVHAGKLAAVGQLAAGVAHELNTPLGAIQLNLDSLARQLTRSAGLPGSSNASMQKKMDLARLAADQARGIVEKLLVYCRDDRSEYQPVDISQVVTQTLEMVQTQLKIPVEVELVPVPPVLGSLLELRQVLTNLLMNARDAAMSPGATAPGVRVQTRCHDDWVFLQVIDHGPGVAPELVSRIFEPFFTTKPVGRGTGLGLSISHRIAVKHGGALEYESPPGAGACFSLRLPALVTAVGGPGPPGT